MASSPRSLLTYHSHVIRLRDLRPLPSGRVWAGVRLLLDLDPSAGSDPLGMFPLFLKRTADVLAPRLSVLFWRLVRLGSFPACQRRANVTPIPKGPPSSSVANYRPISITSVLSKAAISKLGGTPPKGGTD